MKIPKSKKEWLDTLRIGKKRKGEPATYTIGEAIAATNAEEPADLFRAANPETPYGNPWLDYNLCAGEPCVMLKLAPDGLPRHVNIVYYRGVDKQGHRLFSYRPFGSSWAFEKLDCICIPFAHYSPYNPQSNYTKAIKPIL